MINLRDYQQEAIEAILREYGQGVCSQLCILPTGAGKTVVASALAKRFDKRTLFIAHREELIDQAAEKFKLVWPGVKIGICMGERNDTSGHVTVGSVQSCSRQKRLEQLKQQGFELLIVDEAHHAVSDSYQDVISSLGFGPNSGKLLVGITATPGRDGLGDIFEKVSFSRSIATMIKGGYLAPVIGRKILTNFTLSRIRTNNGDFAIDELAEAVNTPERNAFIAEKYQSYAANRKGVAFCVDVQHCHDLAEAFKRRGIAAESVWGDMGRDDRKTTLKALKNGKIQVATSCGVLTEGFDEPSIDAIVMARPTKSKGLYTQCIGRGLRLWPGKQNCLVLDFTDKGHNLDIALSLSSTIPEICQEERPKLEIEREEIDRSPKIEVFENVDREFDVLGCARFVWVPIGDGEWSLLDDEKHEIVVSPKGDGHIASIIFANGIKHDVVKDPLPLEYCTGVCEDYARRHLKIAFAEIKSPWMQGRIPPTQAQRDFLMKNNAFKEGMTKPEASLAIRRIIALKNKQRRSLASEPITQRQRIFLLQNGITPHNMNKLAAMQAIAKIKKPEKVING